MNKFNVIALGLAASASAGLTAHAAPFARIDGALQSQSMVEQVQYRWAGREYCFYDDGWHGPGWYWCGYRLRTGFGWGGPMGWHSWNVEREPRGRVGVVERGSGRTYVERGGGTVEHRGATEVHPGMRIQGTVGANERGVTTGRGEIGARTTTGHTGSSLAGGNISGGNASGGAGRIGAAPTTTGSGAHFGGGAAAGGGRGGGAPGGGNHGEH
jgi:hypothetical protein